MKNTKQTDSIDFGPILLSFDPNLRKKIERSITQWTPKIKELLTNETGLRLERGEVMTDVVVEVKDQIEAPSTDSICAEGIDFAKLKQRLDDPIVGAVSQSGEDILGTYSSQNHRIELYWQSIGLIARLMQVEAEGLAFVVLAHQLANAFIQGGIDHGGNVWDTEACNQADHQIKIGLAQFYTEIICRELRGPHSHTPYIFNQLTKIQSDEYQAQQLWGLEAPDAKERIRSGLIKIRNGEVCSLEG